MQHKCKSNTIQLLIFIHNINNIIFFNIVSFMILHYFWISNLKSVNASKWNDIIFMADVISSRLHAYEPLLQAQYIVFNN